jgi:hypothetical protein
MMFPRRDRRSAAQTRIATLVALGVILAGLWLLRQREAVAPERTAPTTTAGAEATPGPKPRGDEAAEKPGGAPDAAAAAERYDLGPDETKGGHTLARHVARSDAQLRERLAREPGISAASSYTTQALAERTVARTLTRNVVRVTTWMARSGSRPNLALDYRGARDEILGRSVRRGRDPVDCTAAIVVLKWDGQRSYYVLTSYPEPAR